MHAKLLVAAAFLVCTTLANADTFTVSFSESGSGTSGSGDLTLTTTSDPNIDEITAVTGIFSSTAGGFSGAITGLNPGSYSSANPTEVNSSSLVYDNIFYPSGESVTCYGVASAALFDYCGLDFIVDGTYEVAFFGEGSSYFILDGNLAATTFFDNNTPITLSVSAIPEPSSIALLGTGLMSVAGVVRKRV